MARTKKPQRILPSEDADAPVAGGLPGAVGSLGQTEDLSDVRPLSVEEYLAAESAAAPAADPETLLFNKFLSGNDDAFRLLYDAYERPLFIYCCRIMASDADAQDVQQDIWIRMYRLRGERTGIKKFSGLLFTIARNLCLNSLRDNRNYLQTLPLDDVQPQSFARKSGDDPADLRQMVQTALGYLPFAQREAFVLREYGGYSYQEIASITGVTMVTAKTRAWRARERLRKVLAAWMDLKQVDEE